jgi:hypothetical protein
MKKYRKIGARNVIFNFRDNNNIYIHTDLRKSSLTTCSKIKHNLRLCLMRSRMSSTVMKHLLPYTDDKKKHIANN